jgi:hypothetical protein
MKAAGLSFVGFCTVALAADRMSGLGPGASQIAGFCGAFLGAAVAQTRLRRKPSQPITNENGQPTAALDESKPEVVQHEVG